MEYNIHDVLESDVGSVFTDSKGNIYEVDEKNGEKYIPLTVVCARLLNTEFKRIN